MCIGIIRNNSFLVGGRARAEARIDPRPLRTSRSTAHGAQVVWPMDYMGRASVCVSVRLSVCPTGYLRNHTRDLYQIFSACCLWPWLGLLPEGWRNPKRNGQFWGFTAHWQWIVTRSLQITSFISRVDHSVAAGRWRECTVRAKCDLRLPCFVCE